MRVQVNGEGDQVYYFLTDHLGSTSVSYQSDGGETRFQSYKPWGELRPGPGTSLPTDRTYTGQRWDSYINLHWYGSRWYDDQLGRWTQPDWIVPEAAQGVQAWDRYSYSNNSPLVYNDPSGHCIFGIDTIICVALAGAAIGAAVGYGAQVINNYRNESSHPWTENISAEPIVGGAILGTGAVLVAPAAVAAGGDVLVGTGLATGSTTLFGAGMSAYGASTALGNLITGAPIVSTAPTLNTSNEIGAWGEQQVGNNLPVNIQQQPVVDPVTGQIRVYDGNFANNPRAYVEVKTTTRGVVYATQGIKNQIAFDSNVGADTGISPTWIFVNGRPSGPLVNLMQKNQIPWHQLNIPVPR